MIYPSRQLVMLSLVPLTLTFGLYVIPSATPVVLVADIVLVCLAMIDFLTLPQNKNILVQREMSRIATRGEKHTIKLFISNRSGTPINALIRDDLDHSFQIEKSQEIIETVIAPKSKSSFSYQITPSKRGEYYLDFVHLMVTSKFKLWKRHLKTGPRQMLRVYPALKQISRYALYARQNKMSLLGLRRTRRAGTDNEFERLRDYTPDDRFRAIDWRATSRRLKLTVRDYQTNQSQRIIFMIDSGRMMVNEHAGFSLFDAAIDAILTLSFVALSRHDQVGLLCFDNQVQRWIPPKSGRSHLNTLVHAVHDIEPQLVESRFDEAFLHLHRHCRKRTLVVLLTNVIDDRNSQSIQDQVSNLVGQHLPLTVLMRDHALFDPADKALNALEHGKMSTKTLFEGAAAADILLWREKIITQLKHAGVLTLDVFPEDTTAPLINEYLRIKARMLL